MDISMPGTDEFEILADMDALRIDHSLVFIIMLTTSIGQDDRQKAATYGNKLQRYLTKPLKQEDFEEIMLAWSQSWTGSKPLKRKIINLP